MLENKNPTSLYVSSICTRRSTGTNKSEKKRPKLTFVVALTNVKRRQAVLQPTSL